jgi:Ferritin-like
MSSQHPVSTRSSTRVVNTVPAQRPPFRIPAAPPAQWTPDTVIPYVKTAMMIELSTIPLYLYSKYSIQPDDGKMGTQARTVLRGSTFDVVESFDQHH